MAEKAATALNFGYTIVKDSFEISRISFEKAMAQLQEACDSCSKNTIKERLKDKVAQVLLDDNPLSDFHK